MIGSAITGLAWFVLRGGPEILRSYTALRDARNSLQVQLAAAARLIADESDLRDSAQIMARELIDWAPRLVPGRTKAESDAELVAALRIEAERHHVTITQLNPVADSLAPPFRVVEANVRAEADIKGLASWLRAIETGPRLFRIREALITATNPLSPRAEPERLEIQLVVAGIAALHGDSASPER